LKPAPGGVGSIDTSGDVDVVKGREALALDVLEIAAVGELVVEDFFEESFSASSRKAARRRRRRSG